ncbi:pyridoxal-phosphate dependent enzyme [Polymorphospora rubra]|uniref:pyridoxal-phosphate dependent enzyme n=1 Tax=Polymorphospora rubra TaxID=338584 RepID=UPI0033F1D1CE
MLTATVPDSYLRPEARGWRCRPAPGDVPGFHRALDGYRPTPLVELPALAAEAGVGRLFVKDESDRFGLPAFKILGASWAIRQALAARAGSRHATLVAATEGNHGRAVARVARMRRQPAHIFVPATISAASAAAIRSEGATVTTVPDGYDETVRRAAAYAAEDPSRLLIQDTAWPGYEQVPGWIVEGYSTLFHEVDAQLAAAGATPAALVGVPVGVGSLAQAAVVHHRSGPGRPAALLGVEPAVAGCVTTSLRTGALTEVPTGTTVLAGLNCGVPSSLAWPYLRDGLDAATTVSDDEAVRARADLAALGVPAGASGAAPLAGLRAMRHRTDLGLTRASTVVLLSTDGAAGRPA